MPSGSGSTAMPVREQIITDAGTPATISVLSSGWTAVPATASVFTGRTGAFVTVDDAAGVNCYGIVTMSTAAPGAATTIRPITFSPGSTQQIPLQSGSYLWMVANTGTVSVHVLEVVQ